MSPQLVRKRVFVLPVLTALLVAACSSAGDDVDSSEDAVSAKYGGLREGTDGSCAVLRVANEASLEMLDGAAGLDVRAATGVIKFRAGEDGKLGTHDDRWFSSLAKLDGVKWFGPSGFKRLKAYAEANADYTCGVVPIQLLAFNDFHGNLKPPAGSSGRITTGPLPTDVVDAGGSEFFATHIKKLKAENPNTLVVAAGDIIGASPLMSSLFHDEPAIESMNALGLDVATVGNHEFDEGPEELLRMQNGGCHPVDGCQDGDGFDGARFRYLSANVVRQSTGKTIFPSYQVKSFRGARVAFIGVTLEGTPLVTSPAGVVGLQFKNEAATINALVPEIRAQGVEAIVVLMHEGGATTGLYNECVGISGALFEIVNNLDPAIDAVVAGHTNQAHICNVNGKLVTSAASFGRLVTDIDLTIDEKTGHVVSMQGKNVIATRDVPKDADQTTIITKYDALSAPLANRLVGNATGDLLKTPNLAGESSMGDVIADSQHEATKPNGAVAAFMNIGGVRADIVAAQSSGGEAVGAVTYGEAFTVQPFGNTLMTITVTGEQIKTMLEQQWKLVAGAEKAAILQVSESFAYTWDSAKPIGSRVDPQSMKIAGQVVVPANTYRITVNAFLADGGDGFSVLKSGTDRVAGGLDLDALLSLLTARSPLAPPASTRITRL
jgi:5'-nucleotidase